MLCLQASLPYRFCHLGQEDSAISGNQKNQGLEERDECFEGICEKRA